MSIVNVPFTTIGDAQSLVKETLDDVAKAVVSTMGPNGHLALIEIGTSVKVTKDGVSVAKALKLDDPRKEVISRIIIEPSIKTDVACGDGTTTTIFFTWLLYRLLTEHTTYVERAKIEKIFEQLITRLEDMATIVTLDDQLLDKLALTSSNNDKPLAEMVVDIYRSNRNRFPSFELKEGVTAEDKVIVTDKMVLHMTMANPAFSFYGNGIDSELDNFILVGVDNTLKTESQQQVNDITAKLVKLGSQLAHPESQEITYVVIVARNAEHSFNNILTGLNAEANNKNSPLAQPLRNVRFVAAQTNAGGAMGTLIMQDLCIALGGQLHHSLDQYLDNPYLEKSTEVLTLGSQRSVVKLSPEGLERTRLRVESIKQELESYQLGERFSPKAKVTERRIRELSGSLVTILVGGETQSDVRERIDRFEDVVKAVKSALENGVLPGVGTALPMAFDSLEEFFGAPEEMVQDIRDICSAQYVYLMKGCSLDDRLFSNVPPGKLFGAALQINESLNGDNRVKGPRMVRNLSTGEVGTAEELGVYDTAFAAITALKGGYKTAKILASASSLLLGSKLGAVTVKTS